MLIGITGTAGVGKSTLAEHFKKFKNFEVLSYAGPLKEALCALTGLPMEHFTVTEKKEVPLEFGKSPRELMQLMGSEFVRNTVDENFWIWRMKNQINERESKDIIIDDIRFPNEAELVRRMGGRVIHLKRNFESPTVHNGHASEQVLEVIHPDIVLNCDNLGTLATYIRSVEELSR